MARAETVGATAERELLSPGHLACQGCGAALAMRLVLKALGPRTVVVLPASCWSVINGPMLASAGVEIRSFNPPRIDRPFGWISRDHRKVITIDGRLGFVSGLCVGRSWVGDPERHIEAWRDTGVVIEGPAVADLELAFAETW